MWKAPEKGCLLTLRQEGKEEERKREEISVCCTFRVTISRSNLQFIVDCSSTVQSEVGASASRVRGLYSRTFSDWRKRLKGGLRSRKPVDSDAER